MTIAKTKSGGTVVYICVCGYECSARSAFAALQAMVDHANVCNRINLAHYPPPPQEKKS